MTIIAELILYSFQSVFTIIVVAFAGAMLVKYKVLNNDHLMLLAKLTVILTLPCLLATKVAANIDFNKIKELWVLPLSCFVYTIIGLTLGYIMSKLIRPKKEIIPGMIVTTGFGNAAYMPMSLILAITVIFPVFAQDKDSAATGIAYISLYLLTFSPMMWSLGYFILSGKKYSEFKLKSLFPPPVIGLLIGAVIGFVPFLKDLFVARSGFLYPVYSAAELIAAPTVALALLVLGGKLAHGPIKGAICKKSLTVVAVSKLIILPCFALLYVQFLLFTGIIPNNILLILILVLEAAAPPATNTVIMSALIGKNEDVIATILFWLYMLSIITITFFIMITMWIHGPSSSF